MKLKKIISSTLIIAIFVSQFNWINFIFPSVANATNTVAVKEVSTNIATKYFYNQLTENAKIFYNAMEEMLAEGSLKTGTAEKEITNISGLKEKLEAYTTGSQELLDTMGAARDAFIADHPDIFYVDFEALSMRVTKDNNNQLHLHLGTGRRDNYINKDFLNADGSINTDKINTEIERVNNKIDEIVNKAKNIQIVAGQDLIEQQVKLAHDEVIKAAEYKYDYEATAPYSVRTIYGIFGSGNAVCEGFSRALKTILDRLDIPCVLVIGVYRHTEEQPEPHMWTYIQLSDGKWYCTDPTFDNTDTLIDVGNGVQQEDVSTKYLLVGSDRLSKHIPTGIMSPSNFTFSYPPIESISDKFDIVYDEGLLKVELDDENWSQEDKSSTSNFRISYNGKGFYEAGKEGHWIVINQYQEYADGTVKNSGWSYPNPNIYSIFKDTAEYIEIPMPHIPYFEVAITDIAPAPHESDNLQNIIKETTYLGSETSLQNQTGIIYNPNGDYIAPPFIKKATPALNSSQTIGKKYHITLEYDDILKPDEDPSTEIGIEIEIFDRLLGKRSPVDKKYYKVENFQFDGQSTISLDLTPSEMFADDSVFYSMQITGLVGVRSLKKPTEVPYFFTHGCQLYAYTAQGFDLNLYGKPMLMDDVDVTSMNIDGLSEQRKKELSDLLKHRLTLVTTKTTDTQEKNMLDVLNKELSDEATKDPNLEEAREVYETETYNINLTLCKKQSNELLSGNWDKKTMRIMVGFPSGYGPEDAGVTFKAYHYTKNEQGEITGIEEIPCTVTELGLIIEVSAFSPFTIAAVEATEEEKEETAKSIVVNATDGGSILEANTETPVETITTLENENTKTLKIKADEGYEIDEIIVGTNIIDLSSEAIATSVNSEKEYTLELNYADLKEDTTMLKVAFAAESVHQNEKENNLSVIAQPVVANPTFNMNLNVYKINTLEQDSSFKLGGDTLNPNDEFELAFSIESLNNIGLGINTIGGTINYDKEKFELIEEIKEENSDWSVNINKATGSFIATYEKGTMENPLSTSTGKVFSVKFKVLAQEVSTETIIVTNITGGTGKTGEGAIATANDISTLINITVTLEDSIKPKEDSEEAKKYIFGETYITVPLGTTIQTFNDNIVASQTPKYYETIEALADTDSSIKQPQKIKTLEDVNRAIHTGDTVSVGEKSWTFVVIGDVDGDGTIGINDLGKTKLHVIGKELLYGAFLEAAENDKNEGISVNDVSRIKLFIIQKLTNILDDLK